MYWTNIDVAELPAQRDVKLRDIIQPGAFDGHRVTPRHYERLLFSTDVPKGFSKIDPEIAACMVARQYHNYKGTFVSCADGWPRRLTRVECERLQTMPDNYTKAVSEAKAYKMLGNGWTAEIIAHIFSYL